MKGLALLVLCACARSGTPTFFEAHGRGRIDGQAVTIDFRLEDAEVGVVPADGGFSTDLTSGSFDGWPNAAPRLHVDLPPQLAVAGVRSTPVSVQLDPSLSFATDGTQSVAELLYEDARFLGEADERVALAGFWTSTFTFARGKLQLAGKFQLVARCGPQDRDVRVCGGGATSSAPFTTNDCPAGLDAAADFQCAFGLCASDRFGVDAGGCRWHRFALAGEGSSPFALAAWAEPGCTLDKTTCNASR